MAYEQRDMSGVLFKNDRKEKPNHPDYQGECKINGQTLRMAAWIKDGRKGKFMSFSFSEPREQQNDAPARDQRPNDPAQQGPQDQAPWDQEDPLF